MMEAEQTRRFYSILLIQGLGTQNVLNFEGGLRAQVD